MSIATYADLQTAVANWTHRDDLTSIIPDLILLAEKRIFREVRVRVMEKALSDTIANGVIAVPTDYAGLKFAYIDATPTSILARSSASKIYSDFPTRTASAKPKQIGREGSSFIFGPYPDSAYAVKGIYYAKPVSIQTSANDLFTANPDLYLMATLCECAPYLEADPRIATWEMKYAAIKEQLAFEDDDEYGSGGGLAVSVA